MTSFVLVHGAWHGGWCWRGVADRLSARGHRVFAPTLSGVADRSHLLGPEIDLDTHIADIANLVRWEGLADIVLVGHSYGGMVISGVAERAESAIGALVYLDAFVPEDGQALIDLVAPEQAAGILAQGRHGGPVAPIPAANFLVNPADRAWVDAQCTPHPGRCFTQMLRLTGARDRVPRRVYILAGGYGRFARFHDPLVGAPAWRTQALPCGHDVMLDMPDELADLLEQA